MPADESRPWHGGRLTGPQALLVQKWLGPVTLAGDYSWGITDTQVLHVRAGSGEFIVKAAGTGNHHLGREIRAFRHHTAGLNALGLAAALSGADETHNVLALNYLPGSLAEGTAAETEPAVHEQAGRILRIFHSGGARHDSSAARQAVQRSLRWLAGRHRINPQQQRAAQQVLATRQPGPVTVVPCHGDWQPRNWLVHEDQVRVIDFGRFDWRPPETDFARLAAQQWRNRPELEAAFFRGYGPDPRADNPLAWHLTMLHEAIATAAWAFQVGAEAFEAQGHRMLEDALALFPAPDGPA